MTFPTPSGKDCVRAWDAMPWVLQESAPQEQRQWLQEHLADCAACRAEFAQQARLRRAVSLPSDVPVDANDGLRRLLSRLDAPDLQELHTPARSGNWLNRALVAAVLIQALGLGALGVQVWSTGANAPYRTLSQSEAALPHGAIRVVPDASMTLADWNELLHALRLNVVRGPNDVGAYTVAPMDAAPTTSDALQQLRVTRGIRLAEPVADPP